MSQLWNEYLLLRADKACSPLKGELTDCHISAGIGRSAARVWRVVAIIWCVVAIVWRVVAIVWRVVTLVVWVVAIVRHVERMPIGAF